MRKLRVARPRCFMPCAAKIRLINLYFAAQITRRISIKIELDNLPQPIEIIECCLHINANQIRRLRRRCGNKMLDQSLLFIAA